MSLHRTAIPNDGYFERMLEGGIYSDLTDNLENLRKIILPENPSSVRFFNSPTQAMKAWALSKGLQKDDLIGVCAPYPEYVDEFFSKTSYQKVILDRDPEALVQQDFSRFSALCFSNPNLADSFCYPDIILKQIAAHLKNFPHLQILSEESTREFLVHPEYPLPGSFREENRAQVSILSGSFGYSQDKFSWLFDTKSEKPSQFIPMQREENTSHRILALKQSRNMVTFKRRLFVMEHNLIRFADAIRPLSLKHGVKLSYWPRPRALYLLFDISPVLSQQGLTATEWCEKLQEKHGIEIFSGDRLGAPGCVRVCLASSIYKLMKAAKALVEAFEGVEGNKSKERN